ncbi:T9SS type A sorting domain-containing protein [Maribellus mangrovi]|uniref:T9SS type A sorting domain-containing protein n=1 Tax=Maribellus mangrovi TaxID=3133146 RepID=UPI0030EEC5C9
MKRILLILVSITFCGFLTAQDNNWEVYLCEQTVTSVALEDDFIWAATDSFLVRLNKADKSTNYYPYPNILAHTTCTLKIDGNGVKWIVCSAKPGPEVEDKDVITTIYRFDGETWDKVEYNKSTPINSLAIDRDNTVWITTGTNLYKMDEGIFKQITPENSKLVFDYVANVTTDKNGNIWLTNIGNFGELVTADLVLLKIEGDNWRSYLSDSRLIYVTMYIDDMGNPWVQQFLGIRKLDVTQNTWTSQLIMSIDNHHILHTMEGVNKYWFIDPDNGIASFDGAYWNYYTKSNSSLPSDRVYQIKVETDGTKWIATGSGLAVLNENGLTSSIRHDQKLLDEIVIYPNPTHDFISLKMPQKVQNSTAEIVTLNGQVLQSYKVNNNQTRLDVSQIPAGVYLLRIRMQDNQSLKKFVKK